MWILVVILVNYKANLTLKKNYNRKKEKRKKKKKKLINDISILGP
jgi:hypothetical protein